MRSRHKILLDGLWSRSTAGGSIVVSLESAPTIPVSSVPVGLVLPDTNTDTVLRITNSGLGPLNDIEATMDGAGYSILVAPPSSLGVGEHATMTVRLNPAPGIPADRPGTLSIVHNDGDLAIPFTATLDPGLVGYIEVPFYTAYVDNGGAAPEAWQVTAYYGRGYLRKYSDGTVYLRSASFRRINNPSMTTGYFRVWVGSSPTVGAFVPVCPLLTSGVWSSPADYVFKPPAGSTVYFLSGDYTTHYLQKNELVVYPTGYTLPATFTNSSTRTNPLSGADSYHWITATPDASPPTNMEVSGKYYEDSSTGQLFYFNVDTGTWIEDAEIVFFNQTAAKDYQAVPYDVPVPTLASGKGVVIVTQLGRSASNAVRGLAMLGPITRNPVTVMYGVPPAATL